MSVSADFISWKMQYQITPIILTGGIAAQQGGAIPIVQLTNPGLQGLSATNTAVTFSGNLADQGDGITAQADGFFANFAPLPGSSLIDNQASTYPLANQSVAANSVIKQPLNVSMLMTCPADENTPWPAKQAAMTALQSSLQQHITQGGLFTVVTPAYTYQNCILLRIVDVGAGDSKQPQAQYKWDFYQPLVSQQAAQQAQNTLIQSLTNGTPIDGLPSWALAPTANPGNQVGTSFASPNTFGASAISGYAANQ